MPLNFWKDESGQTQILVASMVSITLLTGALYALDYTQRTVALQVKGADRAAMRAALEVAVKHAAQIYRNEAGCDPIQLNERLSRIQTDGSIAPSPTAPALPPFPATTAYNTNWTRVMNVEVGGAIYPVSFGPVYHVRRSDGQNFALTDTLGGAMDAMVEVWTSHGAGPGPNDGLKVLQRAVLINNCAYLCSVIDSSGFCPAKTAAVNDDGVVYHSVSPTTNWPGANVTGPPAQPNAIPTCRGGRRLGNLDAISCPAVTDRIDVTDLHILRNHLRSGTIAGTCDGLLLHSGGSCAGGCSIAGTGSCADLNGDRIVDETDLNILEKILRGYLNTVPRT